MFASRIALALGAIYASAVSVGASPLTSNATQPLEKRITHTGRGTWYETGLGACGFTDVDSSPVIAISVQRWGSGGNCNQWMQITNTATGATAFGQTRDACEGCGVDDIDMSPSLFEQLGSLDQGVLQVSWHFEAMGFSP